MEAWNIDRMPNLNTGYMTLKYSTELRTSLIFEI